MTAGVEQEAMLLASSLRPETWRRVDNRVELLCWRGISICTWVREPWSAARRQMVGLFVDRDQHRFTAAVRDEDDNWISATYAAFWCYFFSPAYKYTQEPDSVDGVPWAIHGIRDFHAYQTALATFKRDAWGL